MTFERFMEHCLYDPESGYYTTRKEIFGPEGDYYTSSYTHPLFAEVMGTALAGYLSVFDSNDDLHLVELGSGEGILGARVVSVLEDRYPELFGRLTYIPVDVGSLQIPGQFRGVVFSNEFFDALPVHRVRVVDGDVQEIYVRFESGFEEFESELSDQRILEYMRWGHARWHEGYQYEVNLRMIDVLEELDRRIETGFVLTVDYGYEWEEYAAEERREGTLMCYHQHRAHPNPYVNIGAQDITAHVNFEVLEKKGESLGWRNSDLKSQRKFLREWGLDEKLIQMEQGGLPAAARLEELMGLKNLLIPGGISDTMKVLVQEVRVDPEDSRF